MVQSIVISRGEAVIVSGGLRCNALRVGTLNRPCNKLLAKINDLGQIAGSFRCDRCKAEITVQISKS